jgi:hypothetical protein
MVYFQPNHKALFFADNVYDIHMHRCMHTTMTISGQLIPLLPALALSCPFHMVQPFFLLLLLLLMVRIPIHSCPWFAIDCLPLAASPTPRHPIDQVTYLHRRHQQHELSHLTQLYCWVGLGYEMVYSYSNFFNGAFIFI